MKAPVQLQDLIDRLVIEGGSISTSNEFTADEIGAARKEGRMAADDSGFGYIYSPPLTEVSLNRLMVCEDLLRSAFAIAERQGKDTNWTLWKARLASEGFNGVTAKTFRAFNPPPPSPPRLFRARILGNLILTVFIILITAVVFSQALRLASAF